MATQAETDEQTLSATQNTCSMFIWHKPAVGFLLCNQHPWEAGHLEEGISQWKEQRILLHFIVM